MTHFSASMLSCLSLQSRLQRLTVETAQGPIEFRRISEINLTWLSNTLASRINASDQKDGEDVELSASVRFYGHLRALSQPSQFGRDLLPVFNFDSPDDMVEFDEQVGRVLAAVSLEPVDVSQVVFQK